MSGESFFGPEIGPFLSMGAAENDRKHDDLCVGSMGIRPMDQQRTS